MIIYALMTFAIRNLDVSSNSRNAMMAIYALEIIVILKQVFAHILLKVAMIMTYAQRTLAPTLLVNVFPVLLFAMIMIFAL